MSTASTCQGFVDSEVIYCSPQIVEQHIKWGFTGFWSEFSIIPYLRKWLGRMDGNNTNLRGIVCTLKYKIRIENNLDKMENG